MSMGNSLRLSHSVRRWLRLAAVALGILGQSALLSTSVTLAKDESSAVSHTEQSGIDLHYSHNEATCVACTALSLVAVPQIVVERLVVASAVERPGTQVSEGAGALLLLTNPSRAPPGIL
jgi:TRAP-type C4-dicarboxylate transport system permease small subunit